jgi:hypothetical protein
MDKRVKLVIVTPRSSGKTEILPGPEGHWTVREYEYTDDGKRTKVSDEKRTDAEIVELLQVDGRFHACLKRLAEAAL